MQKLIDLLEEQKKMSEDFDEWNPMREDFNCFTFNCYSRGPGVQLPIQSLPNFNNNKFRSVFNFTKNVFKFCFSQPLILITIALNVNAL
jgi:hypothetical protein